MKEEKQQTFEDELRRLDEIVRALEKGDRALDEALSLFEEGAALTRRLSEKLDAAEQRVVKLQRGPDGEPVETPFQSEEQT